MKKKGGPAWGFRITGRLQDAPADSGNLVLNPDFSLGSAGEVPSGWTIEPGRHGAAPRFVKAAGKGLLIKGNGTDVNAAIKSDVQVEGGKTYLYEVKFRISKGFNPQRSLLFQCYGPRNKDGIFTFRRTGADEVTGTAKISIPGKGSQRATLRIIYRNSPAGEVLVRNVVLKETTPVPERWARVAVMQGKPQLAAMPEIAAAAAADTADMLLFPEFMNGGKMVEEALDGPSASAMAALARKHNMYIAGGIVRKSDADGKVYNTTLLYDRNGKLVASYDKIHLYSPEANEEKLTPGSKTVVYDTDFGRLGFMTCYDSWFTDVTELVALKGAELVLFPNAGYYRSLMPARATDNKVRIMASSLHNSTGIWDTGGRDVQAPDKDPSVQMAPGATFRNVQERKVGNIRMLIASLDLNNSPSPHYNGGTMYDAPGGRKNRAEQIYYLEEDISKEKEKWWVD
jgi:predicted amidohydrolase